MLQNKFKDWVNTEAGKKLDRIRFSSLPFITRAGIIMLLASFVIGYGFPAAIMILSAFNRNLAYGLIIGVAVYIFSWVLGAVGLVMAGKDTIKYPVYFFAKFAKKLFPSYFSSTKHGDSDIQ